MPENEVVYLIATTEEDFETGKILFTEYAASLGVDLSFQNFETELNTINKQYSKPAGGLLLAFINGVAAACAGVRKLAEETAELKRMYVKPGYRGYRLGAGLLQRSLELAKELGYEKIRLDTLQNMTRAKELYTSFGFYEIPSYRFNPLEGTVYMEKQL